VAVRTSLSDAARHGHGFSTPGSGAILWRDAATKTGTVAMIAMMVYAIAGAT